MAQDKPTQRDRIHIDTSHHELYKDLTTDRDGALHPFKTMKDLFLLATFIGYQRRERKCLQKGTAIFAWAQFSAQADVPTIQALAIAETGDVTVLANQDELLTIAEEYANGGIAEISEHLAEMSNDRVANLVGLLQKWMPFEV